VRDEFGGSVYVLEGDGVDVGIESSIVDLSRLDTAGPVLLRPGAITAAMMADVLGTMPLPPDAAAPRASGTLKAHYAPRTTLTLAQADALPQYLHGLSADGRLAWVGRAPATAIRAARSLKHRPRRMLRAGVVPAAAPARQGRIPAAGVRTLAGKSRVGRVRDRLGRAAAAFEDC
jgi:L-threonylcarbamoyladenylate synthase